MAEIPNTNPLDSALNETEVKSEHRSYVGLSQIGHSCPRYLQYIHYWAFDNTYSTRIQRLFDTGHHAENVMIEDLKTQNIDVFNREFPIKGFSGHFRGHIDGVFLSTSDDKEAKLIEFKTHNDKSFKDLLKKSVKGSKPVHYSQMQSYMGYLNFNNGLYMAMNKNDSTYYFERVRFDPDHFDVLQRKEKEIILSEVLLPRIGTNSPTWFECKFCDAREVCFNKVEPSRNCRTCSNVHVMDDGKWVCGFTDDELSVDDQRVGCDKYSQSIMFKEVT